MQQWDCATWLILMKSAQEEKRVVERYRENLKDVFRNKILPEQKKMLKKTMLIFLSFLMNKNLVKAVKLCTPV